MPVSSEQSAVAIVMPALGPSLGIAPSGTWMWMSLVSKKSFGRPELRECVRTSERAAFADSFMTSPSWPVSVRRPLPFIAWPR